MVACSPAIASPTLRSTHHASGQGATPSLPPKGYAPRVPTYSATLSTYAPQALGSQPGEEEGEAFPPSSPPLADGDEERGLHRTSGPGIG